MPKKVKICDMEISYDVSYRDIKHPRLEFKTGELLVVLPHGYDESAFLDKYKSWIYSRRKEISLALDKSKSIQLIKRDEAEFKELVDCYVDEILDKNDLELKYVRFQKMISKWASCSSNKIITINVFLKYLPENLIQYVIHHEMMHLREKQHNERFWNYVEIEFPRYKQMETELFSYWFLIQNKICRNP